MEVLEKTQHGIDKITRYGWNVHDAPGRFMLIEKSRLEIDHEYQRRAQDRKVIEISRNWSWVACATIAVGHRGGRFWVIDGQYRTLAALRRSDIAQLPCMVFETEHVREEAQGFLRINANRKPITSLDKFKAEVSAGDKTALIVDEILTNGGREAGAHAEGAKCLTAIKACVEKDEAAFRRIWPLLCELCKNKPLHNVLVRTLFYIECRMPDDEHLSDRNWHKKIAAVGFDELLVGAAKAAGFYGKGGEKVWAIGLLTKINYRSRSPLRIAGVGEE